MFKKLLILLTVVLFWCPSYAQRGELVRLKEGFDLSLDSGGAEFQKISIRVITDNIVRVRSTKDPHRDVHESLMLTDSLRSTGQWKMNEDAETVKLSTSKLLLEIDRRTGVISFADATGRPLLRELARGAESWTPASHNGDLFFAVTQRFAGASGEAFYGLGQHQNGLMNYSNRQVLLSHYNTDVAIPFVLSSKNYGILWDNYSITKAGDIRDYSPLSGLRLYANDGSEGWLSASYINKDGSTTVRAESDIDYSYLKDLVKLPQGFKSADGKVIWEGSVAAAESGMHTFQFKYAGYLKVWIDGKLVADRWRQPWNAGVVELQQKFEAGRKLPIKIEWIPDGAESYLSAGFLSPLPANLRDQFSFSSEAGDAIDYYFVAGGNADEVIAGYRLLSGKAPIVPQWALGFWQSRERYKTAQEILETAAMFRSRKIPLDNIVLDWSYWKTDEWGSQEFDSQRFPDADQMIRDLHDKYHTRFMISVWPKFYKGIKNYDDFKSRGWLYMRNIADGRKDWIGSGYSSTFYDPFNPEARKGFWSLLHDKLYARGVDAWWLDATEPDIHSNLDVPTRKSIFSPSIGSSTRYFNAFPLLNAKGIYEGQRAANPGNRVFILTRSAYAGQQRYGATTWSGDISSRWHDMRDQISAGINFSLSGLPYWTMDIGGFSVERRFEKAAGGDLDEWREMNTRWFQFGAFCPIFRVHGQYPFREIYNIAPEGHPAYSSMLYYNKLRYRLMPYIYSLAGMAYHKDYTMMRGLIMDSQEQAVYNIDDQFMFGPALLINPVTRYKAVKRELYLPGKVAGWYDLYSGKYFKAGQRIEASAPYERMPVFVKAGSIIVSGPELQYTGEKPASELIVYVYAGQDGSFTLYEDDGRSYEYEKGSFSTIRFDYDDRSGTLRVGSRAGSFPGVTAERTISVVRVAKDKAVGMDFKSGIKERINYRGKEISIRMR